MNTTSDLAASAAEPLLSLQAITKRFGSFAALSDVSLDIRTGEIHCILGENGAGKSTLCNLIFGVHRPDSGVMRYRGAPFQPLGPADSLAQGIAMVHQHFSLVSDMTVVDNVLLGRERGVLKRKECAAQLEKLAVEYGLPLDPYARIEDLSVGERQRVEIIRCLLQNPKLLILDEPTSVLTPQAVRSLFEVLRTLAAEGCSILYISHKLDEIRELCDGATILRGGRVSGTANPKQTSAAELARLMVGAELPDIHREAGAPSREPRLEAIGLSTKSEDPFGIDLNGISLSVHGGEILGIAGVSGNGQAELLSQLSGERTALADMIQLDGKPVGNLSVAERRTRGLAFVPEERLGRGAVPEMSLGDNALLTAHANGMVQHGMIDRGKVANFAGAVIERFGVKCIGPASVARSLSGGNLQKFIIGREVSLKPHVLIVSQPTWGVDVAASAFIRQALINLSRQGAAVLVISEELEELFQICDRIAVIYQGRLSPAKPRAATNVEEVGLLMAGVGPSFRPAA
jgi:ABC-type uncharacterized transport system ATPase subunit